MTIDANMNIGTAVQSQYFSRPADQRFSSLADLEASVASRRARTVDTIAPLEKTSLAKIGSSVGLQLPGAPVAVPTYHAFGQLASRLGAPAGYLRGLPTELALANLRHGMMARGDSVGEALKMMVVDPSDDEPADASPRLTAVTGETYGRIWDADVVAMVRGIVDASGGQFFCPPEWGGKAGGLYASDDDVFMFQISGGSIVDGGGERDQLHRGFYCWNSEVGKSTMGIAAFLFRQVCGNYGIHGIEQAQFLKIRHTSGGPARFAAEAGPHLQRFLESSVKPLEDSIKVAKGKALPHVDEQLKFAKDHAITRGEWARAKAHAEAEEGQFASVWDAYNGLTAAARVLAHADARADLSARAGKMLDRVTQA